MGARSSFVDLTAMLIALVALAIIIVPQYLRIKNNAHLATIRSDLRSLVSAEESYYSDYRTYTTALPPAQYVPSPGVTYQVEAADATGWRASASSRSLVRSHRKVTSCHVAVGSAVHDGETEADPTCP
jgi:Tfp pilus assembly protein PilE